MATNNLPNLAGNAREMLIKLTKTEKNLTWFEDTLMTALSYEKKILNLGPEQKTSMRHPRYDRYLDGARNMAVNDRWKRPAILQPNLGI